MIDTGAGVIDADYRGVIFVLLFNLSDKDFQGVSNSKPDYCVLLNGMRSRRRRPDSSIDP
jgi:hypothetical protein